MLGVGFIIGMLCGFSIMVMISITKDDDNNE